MRFFPFSSPLSGGVVRVSRSIHAVLEPRALFEVKINSLALFPHTWLFILRHFLFFSMQTFPQSEAQKQTLLLIFQDFLTGPIWWGNTFLMRSHSQGHVVPRHTVSIYVKNVTPPLDVKSHPWMFVITCSQDQLLVLMLTYSPLFLFFSFLMQQMLLKPAFLSIYTNFCSYCVRQKETQRGMEQCPNNKSPWWCPWAPETEIRVQWKNSWARMRLRIEGQIWW